MSLRKASGVEVVKRGGTCSTVRLAGKEWVVEDNWVVEKK